MAVRLDRVAVEAVGANPVELARAIHRQLLDLAGPVPVYEIARALDIEEIREQLLTSFEGCLLTDRQKSYGAILVNAASSPRRRRYTVGHELGHFLNERHLPTTADGFACTKQDMAHSARAGRHLRQEREANTFAIELLAPRRLIWPYLERPAELTHALALAGDLEISREAAARRYVALHDECLAVVFSAGDRVRYVEKGRAFPGTAVWAGDALPELPARPRDGAGLTALNEVNPAAWLSTPDGVTLFAQTLYQADAFAMTLLLVERNGLTLDDFDL
jgi:hypothetical protein